MVSHNKEAVQTVKTQHFPADNTLTGQIYRLQFRIKTLKANQKGADHECIAYILILNIVETRDIIVSNNICDVHGYAG